MPCIGNCLGTSTTASVDLRKQSNRQLTSDFSEIDQPKGESYKKLRNSFLGESNYSPTMSPATTQATPKVASQGIPQPPPPPPALPLQSLPMKKNAKIEKKLKKLNKSSSTMKDALKIETHPKMLYLSEDAEESGETIDMEVLEPLVGSSVNQVYPSSPLIVNNNGSIKHTMDFNLYAAKKNISQGLIDIALLTANFSQLKFILSRVDKWPFQVDFTSWGETFKLINLTLVLTSIGLQILVGIALLLSARLNLNDDGRTRRAESCNTLIIVCVFVITVINIFIVVFLDDYEEFELV
ncbi:uncharacterized protein LOC107368166 [Tetranychus urticae]|uniref:Uncharacterized protein n=1 Tax=Tetranychus urticae TaxID=32264 RepID=T1KWW9_TETUR|nr:uncharacterized protein LOC107368166 [Tetranychus urticae]